MTLTEAINKTIEIWEERERTGEKDDGGCDLCALFDECEECLYYKKFEASCLEEESPYYEWSISETPEDRKHWAGKVLAQARELKG